MSGVKLYSRIHTDINSNAQVTDINFHLSIKGKIHISEQIHECNTFLKQSLSARVEAVDFAPEILGNVKRGLAIAVNTDKESEARIIALRRRNLPLPPQGQLTILKADREAPLHGATLRQGDTHLLQLTAVGSFSAEPEIVFVLKCEIGGEPLTVKTNSPTQGDIVVTNISTATTQLGEAQRLTAQIALYPSDTQSLSGRKVLFYTAEIIDRLTDETYTIESDKFVLEFDIYNHFANK